MINKKILFTVIFIVSICGFFASYRKTANVDLLLKDLYQKNLLIMNHTHEDSRKLILKLKEIFESEGVPGEWVWLIEIESNFNLNAVSHRGAKGLFQFMPETAKRFGLEIDGSDERLSPEKSARAAARYLKFLYEKFGSWRLTLAAYNAGEGRVEKLLQEHNTKTFDHISFDLPAETRHYVKKVMDVVESRENVDPRKLPAPTFA